MLIADGDYTLSLLDTFDLGFFPKSFAKLSKKIELKKYFRKKLIKIFNFLI